MKKNSYRTFLIFITVSFFLPFLVFTQNKLKKEIFQIETKRKTKEYKNEINFIKANFYFSKKNWDSTLVYANRQINNLKKDVEINDYCYYFRAVSFLNKRLFSQAKKELTCISTNFRFYYKVKITFGIIALNQEDYKKALVFFESIENQPNDGFDIVRSEFYHNLGICYFVTKNYNKAEIYLLQSSRLLVAEKDTLKQIRSCISLGNLYYEQYKDKQAIPYFEKAYQLSKKVNNFELKQNAAENMAVVEENRKNLTQALVYRKEFEQWKDSLNDQNKIWSVVQAEKKYALKQKQKEINLLEAENKLKETQSNGLIIVSILLLILFGTGVYFYRHKIKHNKIIVAQKENLHELNTLKDKLFSIVSHDLRSSVNALKTSNKKLLENLESKNYNELDTLLHTNSSIANGTYNLLDNLLNWAMLQTKQSYFHQELHRLHVVVEQAAFDYKPFMLEKNIQFYNKISNTVLVFVDLDSIKIILRNLFDNAIKFSNQNDKITVYSNISSDNFCELIIEDIGKGMDIETQSKLLNDDFTVHKEENSGTGLGMQLCKSLIHKNGGKFAIESEVNIGTKIIVYLPVNA